MLRVGIVGNTKSVNNVVYKSFIAKSILVVEDGLLAEIDLTIMICKQHYWLILYYLLFHKQY